MANRIYTNGEEGKILTSVGNRIIKQPYEFGNAFQNRMGLNNYIEISGLNLTQYCSIMQFTYQYEPSTYGNPVWNCQNSNLDNYSFQVEFGSSSWRKIIKNLISNNQITNSMVYVSGGMLPVYFMSSYLSSDNTSNYLFDSNVRVTQSSVQTNPSPISKIWIGAARGSNGIMPSAYSLSTGKFNRFVFFNRKISLNEEMYFYNNRMGNDIQSTVGLEIDLHNDFAEILDFSDLQDGSDMRVGCRDYSGYNRHGEIMNLPAGTLQQKMNYANANLFVPFI